MMNRLAGTLRSPVGGDTRAPDFLVIGAQKAGSTWLYQNLKLHPEVFMPAKVELVHFNKTERGTACGPCRPGRTDPDRP